MKTIMLLAIMVTTLMGCDPRDNNGATEIASPVPAVDTAEHGYETASGITVKYCDVETGEKSSEPDKENGDYSDRAVAK